MLRDAGTPERCIFCRNDDCSGHHRIQLQKQYNHSILMPAEAMEATSKLVSE